MFVDIKEIIVVLDCEMPKPKAEAEKLGLTKTARMKKKQKQSKGGQGGQPRPARQAAVTGKNPLNLDFETPIDPKRAARANEYLQSDDDADE